MRAKKTEGRSKLDAIFKKPRSRQRTSLTSNMHADTIKRQAKGKSTLIDTRSMTTRFTDLDAAKKLGDLDAQDAYELSRRESADRETRVLPANDQAVRQEAELKRRKEYDDKRQQTVRSMI